MKNIILVSEVLKIDSKAYGVGLTRRDTLGLFTNFLFIFSELGFWRVGSRKFLPFPKLNTEKRRLGKFVNLLFDTSFLYHLFNRLKKHFDAQFVM